MTFFLVAAAVFVYLSKTTGANLLMGGRIMTDFRSFYFAALGFLKQGNIYDISYLQTLAIASGVSGYIYPYLYPPPLAFYLSPLTKLGATGAALLWLILSLVFTVVVMNGSIRLASKLTGIRTLQQERLLALLALLLFLALPFNNNLKMGQVNIFVSAFIVASLVQVFVYNRDVLAGFLLAPAVLVKITPLAVLLFFVMNRRYRTLYGFAAGVILSIVPTLFVSGGLKTWQHFLDFMGYMSYGKTVPGLFPAASLGNFSVAGHLARLLQGETIINSVTLVLLTLLGVGLIVQHKRMMGKDNEPSLLLSYLILMIIASPLTYLHHVIYIYPGLLITTWLVMAKGNWYSYGGLTLILGLTVVSSTDFPLLYGSLRIEWNVLRSLNLYALLFLFVLGLILPKMVVAKCGEHKYTQTEQITPADGR